MVILTFYIITSSPVLLIFRSLSLRVYPFFHSFPLSTNVAIFYSPFPKIYEFICLRILIFTSHIYAAKKLQNKKFHAIIGISLFCSIGKSQRTLKRKYKLPSRNANFAVRVILIMQKKFREHLIVELYIW